MDLKNTINNTNTQKENIKTVATQIDNKLVELGGEQAENLSDVANKMEGMVTGNYSKFAKINGQETVIVETESIVVTKNCNLNFIPNQIIYNLEMIEDYYLDYVRGDKTFIYNSKYNNDSILATLRIESSIYEGRFAQADIIKIDIANNTINFHIKIRSKGIGYDKENLKLIIGDIICIETP